MSKQGPGGRAGWRGARRLRGASVTPQESRAARSCPIAGDEDGRWLECPLHASDVSAEIGPQQTWLLGPCLGSLQLRAVWRGWKLLLPPPLTSGDASPQSVGLGHPVYCHGGGAHVETELPVPAALPAQGGGIMDGGQKTLPSGVNLFPLPESRAPRARIPHRGQKYLLGPCRRLGKTLVGGHRWSWHHAIPYPHWISHPAWLIQPVLPLVPAWAQGSSQSLPQRQRSYQVDSSIVNFIQRIKEHRLQHLPAAGSQPARVPPALPLPQPSRPLEPPHPRAESHVPPSPCSDWPHPYRSPPSWGPSWTGAVPLWVVGSD